MADIITYPENGITYDADDASGFLSTRLSGVYSAEEDFSVTAQGGLSVQVSAGQAWVRPARFKGRSIIMEQPTTVVLTEADPVRSRIDRIVLRYDAAAKKTRLQVLDGTPDSAAPAAPEISRTELVYDLCLAEIRRPAGSTAVTAADITDTRADETVCGVMRDGVNGIPAATLIQRLRAEIDKLVDKDSFYNKAETDAMLDELQEQVSKMGASGQPIAVWSYYASFSSLKSYKYSIPDSVDYIVVKKDLREAMPQTFIPRGKTGVAGYFSITFAEDGTLSLYADAVSGHTLYFVGYHYLTATDGVKVQYAVNTKTCKVDQYYGTSFTVDTNVDYIVMEWAKEETANGSSSSVTVSTKYSEIIVRETPDGTTDSFSSSGTVKIRSNGGNYVNITMYHYATPEELNSKLVAAESAQADADEMNVDQAYRLTLLELNVSDTDDTENT